MVTVLKLVLFLVIVHLVLASTIYSTEDEDVDVDVDVDVNEDEDEDEDVDVDVDVDEDDSASQYSAEEDSDETISSEGGSITNQDDSAYKQHSSDEFSSEAESTDEQSNLERSDTANVFENTVGATWKVVRGPVVPDKLYTGDFTTKTKAASVSSSVWKMGMVCGFRMMVSCQGDGCNPVNQLDQISNEVTIVGSAGETDLFIFNDAGFSVFAKKGVNQITITYTLN